MIHKILIVAAALVLAGCATASRPTALKPSGQVIDLPDISSPYAKGMVPFEIRYLDVLSVAVNATTQPGIVGVTTVTVFFKSHHDKELILVPKIKLIDVNGLEVPAYSYDGFMSEVSALAGTPYIPMPDFKPYTSTTTTQGTIRDTRTGQSYNYEAQSTSRSGGPLTNAVNSYAQGVAMREAIDAADRRRAGQSYMRWASSAWMREAYTVAPNTAVSGVIVFPFLLEKERLPAKVQLSVSGHPFEFVIGAK